MKKISIFLMMLCFACFGVAKAQQSLPYSYGFEDNDLSTDGWIANVTSSSSGINSAAAYSGSYGFRFNYSEQSGSLISPVLTGGDLGVDVSFWYKEYSNSYGDEQFYVGYTTDANTTDVDAFTYGTIVTASTSWQEYTNSFPAGTKRIAIKYVYNDAFYLYLDDFTFEAVSDCPRPRNLEVTLGDGTATATWTSDATSFNIDINGTVTNNVTNPHTFNTELSTAYTVKVQANCEGGETSDWSDAYTFTTPSCLPIDMCSITLALTDSYSDGWNGGKMEVVDARTEEVYGTYTITSGGSANYELALCPGTVVNFVYTAGSYGTENGWVIYDPAGEVITEEAGCNSGCNHTNGIQATYTMDCSGCFKPKNLTETNVSFTSATLSWEGNNDSYVLQYRPWNPAGDDIITTSTLTTYTVDLSQYEGTGSVAIRHYDISDMFQLIVDNIEVTNAAGTVVYSQDFEDCDGNMPAEFSNMDLDGDGYMWEIASSPSSNVDGTYGIVSASYDNNAGALTPDNWLILSGLEMGGQMTFQARGQDPNYAAENFAIYVSTENSIVEVPVTATTYNATNLTPNTPYAWQVKGICGDEETSYASSFFKTKDDMLVFATAGNWNVVSNWKDAEGNAVAALPTADNNVRIDAAAVIPANYVANANKVTIGTGSITIKDGGQLKQSAATLRVTMEKEIARYGESDGYYYFIASPFNGRTKFGNDGSTWSLVDNILEGEYDLYAFDPTEELEWINYQANPGHISFLSEPTSSGSGNPGMLYGEGYLYANQDGTTLEFIGTTGKSNNYSETRDYTFDGESTDDWNGWKLVGNMFTCNAYINYVDADGEVMEADFYTLNNDNTYNLSSSNVGLAPCTGAFINYSATGKVQYATEAPAKAGRNGMINMNVSRGNKTVGQARVRFGQGHNLGSMSFRNGSRIYMNVDGNDYAVVYTENQGEMPVSFRAAENGTYTISFNTEDVELGYLHLIDNMTGTDVNLLSTPSYSFEASTTDYASRFRLVFATGNADDEFAFFSNGSFVINNEGNATVQVMDVNGRILSSENINGCANVNVKAAAGVYMIRLVNGSNVKVQKVVVK